jgi:rubrerythrin
MSARLARLVNPLVWRIPGHGARKLASFARAEEGSRIDLLQAAAATPVTARRAQYLRHALDETRHARMFARRSAELRRERGQVPYGRPTADTEELFARLGEVGFLAFVHRGERRGRGQFATYRDHFAARGDDRSAALFEAIMSDEQRHEDYTRALLVELSGGEAEARRALRRAAAWEAWRLWRRAGRFVAARLYAVLMTALYLALAPLALVTRIVRPARPGWRLPGPR